MVEDGRAVTEGAPQFSFPLDADSQCVWYRGLFVEMRTAIRYADITNRIQRQFTAPSELTDSVEVRDLPVLRRDTMKSETPDNRRDREIHRCHRQKQQQNRYWDIDPRRGQLLKKTRQRNCDERDGDKARNRRR